jgi:hypothetical protein
MCVAHLPLPRNQCLVATVVATTLSSGGLPTASDAPVDVSRTGSAWGAVGGVDGDGWGLMPLCLCRLPFAQSAQASLPLVCAVGLSTPVTCLGAVAPLHWVCRELSAKQTVSGLFPLCFLP